MANMRCKECGRFINDPRDHAENCSLYGQEAEVTERRESVDAGVSRLVGTSRRVIEEWVLRLLRDEETYRRMARKVDVYGDGRSAERIADALGLGEPAADVPARERA